MPRRDVFSPASQLCGSGVGSGGTGLGVTDGRPADAVSAVGELRGNDREQHDRRHDGE